MTLDLIILIVSIAALIVSVEWTVNSALKMAGHFKVSPFIIGLTVMAIGTDLPELFITISGGLQRLSGINTSDLIFGQIVGTTLLQITFTLGLTGLFHCVPFSKNQLKRDGLTMVASVILLFLLGIDGSLSTADGAVLIIFYLLYFLRLIRSKKEIQEVAPKLSDGHVLLNLLFFAIALTAVIASADFVVTKSVSLAEAIGVSQSIIGIFIIGIGASLPELSFSISAIRKNQPTLTIGNLVGSNIFDIAFVMGLTSVISPLSMDRSLLTYDLVYLFIASIIVVLFLRSKERLSKPEAAMLIVVFLIYVISKVFGF